MSYQKYTCVGNLTRDPAQKTVGRSTVTEFGIAVNEKRKDANGEQVEDVCFWDCAAWGKLGDIIAERLQKGARVLIEAKVRFRSWEQDGAKRSKHELLVSELRFLDSRSGDSESRPARNQPAASRSAPESGGSFDDDVPF